MMEEGEREEEWSGGDRRMRGRRGRVEWRMEGGGGGREEGMEGERRRRRSRSREAVEEAEMG